MKLEGQRQALEDAGFHNEILAVLGETNKALKIANKNLDIDMVRSFTTDLHLVLCDLAQRCHVQIIVVIVD